jgi:chaperonin cofactor prefoldin
LKSSGSRITPVPDADDDVETRLTVLEREVARLREQTVRTSSDATAARVDAAAARVLAAGADRDVSEVRAELRAHTQALNALRETQLEQAREMREGFAEMRTEMREGFAKQATGMAQITALLTTIAGPDGLS